MDLFQTGTFKLAAGTVSDFKIECDALTDGEIETLATQLARRLPPFRWNVFGIPRGGLRLARAMEIYGKSSGPRLICDDVYTTGYSFGTYLTSISEDEMPEGWIGAVLFARTPAPIGITALFQMS